MWLSKIEYFDKKYMCKCYYYTEMSGIFKSQWYINGRQTEVMHRLIIQIER